MQSQFEKPNRLFRDSLLRGEQEKKIEANDDISSKRDINKTNELKVYKFEIFNDSYRFRIFKLVSSIAYPVGIVLDEGIAEELGMKNNGKEIGSNAEMERFLHSIMILNELVYKFHINRDE